MFYEHESVLKREPERFKKDTKNLVTFEHLHEVQTVSEVLVYIFGYAAEE
jgi:hypothetical protein